MDRRAFLVVAGAGVSAALAGCVADAVEQPAKVAGGTQFEVVKTEVEWRKILNKDQFRVLRKHDTESPGSSPLNDEHRDGSYYCAGCDLPLYASSAKFESGTGWPSFTAPLANAVGTSVDRSLLGVRTEIHCRRCGGHLGHVFDDGPKPTGKRYCMNGAAMIFKPASKGA
ncbi:MAG: peptide-methionine (R)-S-oxide reductase MsrB [Acidobacteria bacterium]|nr:peptide-methionine (R)-S-oxide reductase MsrB [Acidobacteriota bacterium]